MIKGKVKVVWDEQIPVELARLIAMHEEEIADSIVVNAKASTAFRDRTGKLRKSIKKQKRKSKDFAASVELYDWIVRATAPHAHLVEFGHGGPRPAPPHPFLQPAKEKAITEFAWSNARIAA